MMPIHTDNNFDDRYAEVTELMNPRQMDAFAHGLVGAMAWYLDKDSIEHCLQVAMLLHLQDLQLQRQQTEQLGAQRGLSLVKR